MDIYVPSPVKGKDGAQPLWAQESSPFRIWGIDDVYMGLNGKNRYVPKVHDYVRNPVNYQTWIVTSVHPKTLIPTLKSIRPYGMVMPMDESDVLFGVGPGTQAQLLRVYINRSTYPFRVTVDTHCFVGGSKNAYAVLYRNADPSLGGEPISMMYDNSGNFITEKVPLEMATLDSHDNYSLKIIGECSTTIDIKDADPIYVVFYSADDVPQSKSMLLAENTTYIRGASIQRKFVTSISLSSMWLSPDDPNLLKFPLNIPTDALDLMGNVHYSDGTTLTLPVNGSKFSILGLKGYLSTIVGERQDLVLRYALSDGEIGYAGQGMYVDKYVTQPYRFETTQVQPGYTVKLFPYPFWDSQLNGYRLRWWLLDLARTTFVEVTSFIEFMPEGGPFDPQGYGMLQRKQVRLNLRRVSQSYNALIHNQFFEVTLYGPPWASETPWVISNQPMPNMPGYGNNARARLVPNNKLNLGAGRPTKEIWLEEIMGTTYPMIDRRHEIRPPTPNNFAVSIDDGLTWFEYPIEQWNADLVFQRPITPNNNVLIKFIRRTSTMGTQLISFAAMAIYRP